MGKLMIFLHIAVIIADITVIVKAVRILKSE